MTRSFETTEALGAIKRLFTCVSSNVIFRISFIANALLQKCIGGPLFHDEHFLYGVQNLASIETISCKVHMGKVWSSCELTCDYSVFMWLQISCGTLDSCTAPFHCAFSDAFLDHLFVQMICCVAHNDVVSPQYVFFETTT